MSTPSHYQHDPHFTLDEAGDLLPWLTEKLREIRDLFQTLTETGFDVLKGRWELGGNGRGVSPSPDEYRTLIEMVAELDKKGLLIKDFSQGVVDIPHILPNGEEVYLCWMLGEPKVSFWHKISEGFMGRIPLEESDEQDS